MMILSSKGHSKNQDTRVNTIQQELRSVIDLMGPSTPQHENDEDEPTVSIIEIPSEDKEIIQDMVQQADARPLSIANTPRDYSELSSLLTDTSSAYPVINHEVPDAKLGQSEQVLKNFRPIQKLSTLLGINSCPKHAHMHHHTEKCNANNVDLYRINILQPKSESAPRRVIFDLVEEPLHCKSNVATNTTPRGRKRPKREAEILYRNANCYDRQPSHRGFDKGQRNHRSDPIIDTSMRMQKKTIYQTTSGNKVPGHLDCVTRVDVYYFDHGNSAYYHTTDCPPVITTEILAEKTETYTTKFWAEAFGFLHILFSFLTSFVLQLCRSILQGLVRPLTAGLLQTLSDYCFKPLLATIFNALVQPPLIFVYNIATTLRDICDPIAEGLGYFLREIACLFAAMRFVEINRLCENCGERDKERNKQQQDVENNANLTTGIR